MPQKTKKIDLTTEQKIKAAAQIVFTKKGFAGTRTRDIAEEAGINLALLNYYFRSKEKLFDIIIAEEVAKLFGAIAKIINDEKSTLEQKIIQLIDTYTSLFLASPGLPGFVLNEVQRNPARLVALINANQGFLKSQIARQFKEKRPDLHPMQLMTTVIGMIWFPYISRQIFQGVGVVDTGTFEKLMLDRKKILPPMIFSMLKKNKKTTN